MQLPVHAEVYATLERASPFLICWVAIFLVYNLARIARRPPGADAPLKEGMVTGELPGLPLMLLHSVGFGLSLAARDPVSAALFLWWGPGYVFVATTLLVRARRRARPIDWKPWARLSSWGCKLSYVIFMVIYLTNGLYGLPFVFSAWIVNDQVKLAFLRTNADRARRVTEDLWLPRLGYVAFLFLPFFVAVPLRPFAAALGALLAVLWVAGMVRVLRSGRFRQRPDPHAPDNLRDIVYLNARPY